ncbi:hypothetical protein ACHQM5_010391 [Ranunculus cassubicifolius]
MDSYFGFLPNSASLLCISVRAINSRGVFNDQNPLKFAFPLLILQLFIAQFTALVTSILLKPIGMPLMVSQIIAGILLGPSFLGRIRIYLKTIFPFRSFVMLDTYSNFGTIFQIFMIGIQLNPVMLLSAGRKAMVIGTSVVVVPLTLSTTCALLIAATAGLDKKATQSLIAVGAAQSMSAFPIIALYLTELNILNSEVSRVAFSSSMMSGLLCFTLVTATTVLHVSRHKAAALFSIFCTSTILVGIVVFILRPLVIRMIKKIPEGKRMKEEHLSTIFLATIMLAWLCRISGLHVLFGPFVFGASIPSGPPVGSALVERLEYFNTWMIMPIFYTEHGMRMNFFRVGLKTALVVESVILISCIGKFFGAFLPALYYNMSYKDASLLGLAMNAQGFLELSMYKMLMDFQLIDYKTFEIMSASLVVVTAGLTPIIRYLYNSSMKYKLHNRRTIQQCEPNSELRVLACIFEQEHVPSVIHLLKASNPTKGSPINASIIHFVELLGRATPIVISHKVHRKQSAATAMSQKIINVFRRYEENNRGSISVHPYTVVSPYSSMHNDVCMLAHHKRSSIIILPYHKNLVTSVANGGIRTVNCNVLARAPCSVGILIDRGLLGGIKYVFANWASYHVVVFFLGGNDDREALAYGTRMSEHLTIMLTVIRFLPISDVEVTDAVEKALDDDMVSDFKGRTAYNNRVTYIEEEVKNGIGLVNVIEAMEDKYELILIGRRHNEHSKIIIDLTEWNKSELGTIADVFVTSSYGGKATILVVQQQISVLGIQRSEQEAPGSSPHYDTLPDEEFPISRG